LAWRFSVKGDVTLQHRKQPLAVGGVARFDHDVEDQAASASKQKNHIGLSRGGFQKIAT